MDGLAVARGGVSPLATRSVSPALLEIPFRPAQPGLCLSADKETDGWVRARRPSLWSSLKRFPVHFLGPRYVFSVPATPTIKSPAEVRPVPLFLSGVVGASGCQNNDDLYARVESRRQGSPQPGRRADRHHGLLSGIPVLYGPASDGRARTRSPLTSAGDQRRIRPSVDR